MDNYFDKIKKCRLFDGIEDLETLLNCFGARHIEFKKNAELAGYGDVPAIYMILSGTAIAVSEDGYGNRSLINRISAGGIFGAAYVFAGEKELISRLIAAEDGETVILSGSKVNSPCRNNCGSHTKFICNTVKVISERCVAFLEKAEHLSCRTTRDKMLSYLSTVAKRLGKNEFEIPYSREELADYLAVDRSALSFQLSLMAKEGLISFRRNRFKLLMDFEQSNQS